MVSPEKSDCRVFVKTSFAEVVKFVCEGGQASDNGVKVAARAPDGGAFVFLRVTGNTKVSAKAGDK